jgi:signal transduction histidine kinase/DNA-binding response OmpR family regulator/tetratricopeptide (TPR) repeat protein
MTLLAFFKILYNTKLTIGKIWPAFVGCWLTFYAHSQTTPAPIQQKRIEQLYLRLQQEIITLPITDIPCTFQQNTEKIEITDGFIQVKRLYQNGKRACAIQLMQTLRSSVENSKDNHNQWLLNLSQFLRATGNPDSALVVLKQLQIAGQSNPNLKGWVNYEQAALFRNNIHFEEALQVAGEALQLARSTKDRRLEFMVLSEIGKISRDIYRQEPTKYLSFFKEALAVADDLKDSLHISRAYQNLVFVYFFDDSVDLEKALDYFEKALSYFPRSGSLYERYSLIYTFVNMLSYFPAESEKAIYLYTRLLPIVKKLELKEGIRTIHLYLSGAFIDKKNFPTASAYLDSAMKYDSPDWEKDNFYAIRARVAQALGNLSLSNDYYQKALAEKERVYLRRNSQSMTQWETQFRTREKELQLQQQQRQQGLLLGIVGLVSLLLAVATYSFLRNRKQLQKLALQNTIIEKQRDELRSLDKAKTRFFSNITHEFRTPLTLILSPLESLIEEFPQQKMLKTIYSNANRLLSLINQLLDLSKIDAGALKPDIRKGNLASFLQLQVESFFSLAQNQGVDLQFINRWPVDVEACYDADKLSKIITNLLSNSLKFTPKGGKVAFECRIRSDEWKGIKKEKSEKDSFDICRLQLDIQITDTGIGIPIAQLPFIFERFYQVDSSVKRSFEGSGIGLSLVKELVEVLKGEIRVESEVGKGTTFYLRFPVDAQSWEIFPSEDRVFNVVEDKSVNEFPPLLLANSESTAIRSASNDSAPILLVVEDNSDLRTYIADLFSDTYRIITATDGQSGLNQAFDSVPDVVITDWMMPQMDGITLCRHLKNDARTNHVPVLMLTAKSAIESRLEGFEGGADDYIVKPFHATELQLKVRNWLQRQDNLRQLYTQRLAQPQEVPPLPETEKDFMERIFNLIDEHLADVNFGVEALSERLQLNRRTLQRKIGSLTNLSPNELIRNHRLRRALPLLKQGGTIADVAFRVGFENPSYFSKCFKEVFGRRPSDIVETEEI